MKFFKEGKGLTCGIEICRDAQCRGGVTWEGGMDGMRHRVAESRSYECEDEGWTCGGWGLEGGGFRF